MNTLKCSVCNIVIDELLAYVQNKISIIDEETLKRICVSAFSSSEIKRSKTLLFESLPSVQRKIMRKGNRKEQRDLDDIISAFKTIDPDIIPVFVARVLEKLPPILFDHLDCTKLLKDLTTLSSNIAEIKNTYATLQQLEELRSDVRNLKYASIPPVNNSNTGYVNTKRGAWNMSSGPVGLTMDNSISAVEHNDIQVQKQTCRSYDAPTVSTNKCVIECTPRSQAVCMNESSCMPAAEAIEATSPTMVSRCDRDKNMRSLSLICTSPSISKQKTVTDERNIEGNTVSTTRKLQSPNTLIINSDVDNEEWQTVAKRPKKPKYRFLGKRGKAEPSVTSFKAADKKVPIFITNVHYDTLESDIIDYINFKTNEKVSLEKIYTKKILNHKAYKFFVPDAKVNLFLDETMWPEGIIFRRFTHFKSRRADRMSAPDGPLPFNHG